jgi:hypothetical protein
VLYEKFVPVANPGLLNGFISSPAIEIRLSIEGTRGA